MEDFRKRQSNDRPAALEARYDPEDELQKAKADGLLADYAGAIRDLQKGRGLEAGDRLLDGKVGREINAPERVADYI